MLEKAPEFEKLLEAFRKTEFYKKRKWAFDFFLDNDVNYILIKAFHIFTKKAKL